MRNTVQQTYNDTYASFYDLTVQHREIDKEIVNLKRWIQEEFPQEKVLKILDVGSGTGTHAIGLVQEGWEVHGIDLSQSMVEVAKKKGSTVDFCVSSIEETSLEGMNVCYSIGNVMNYLSGLTALDLFLRNAYRILAPGGIFLFEVYNPIVLNIDPPVKITREYENEEFKIIRTVTPHSMFSLQEIEFHYDIQVQVKNDQKTFDFSVVHENFLFTPREFLEGLAVAGFKDTLLRSSLADWEEVDDTTRVLTFLSKKPLDPKAGINAK